MLSLINHPLLGEVTLSQSGRATRITISVRASGVVRLSFPCGVRPEKALQFLEQKVAWVEAARSRQTAKHPPQPRLPAAQARVYIETLRREAKADLPLRVERISKMLGLKYGRVTIRASRSKWGSCTSGNNLSLSLFMMILPEHLRDFVVVHELCHTLHHNHSTRFHVLVDKCLEGREKALSRELRGFCAPEI